MQDAHLHFQPRIMSDIEGTMLPPHPILVAQSGTLPTSGYLGSNSSSAPPLGNPQAPSPNRPPRSSFVGDLTRSPAAGNTISNTSTQGQLQGGSSNPHQQVGGASLQVAADSIAIHLLWPWPPQQNRTIKLDLKLAAISQNLDAVTAAEAIAHVKVRLGPEPLADTLHTLFEADGSNTRLESAALVVKGHSYYCHSWLTSADLGRPELKEFRNLTNGEVTHLLHNFEGHNLVCQKGPKDEYAGQSAYCDVCNCERDHGANDRLHFSCKVCDFDCHPCCLRLQPVQTANVTVTLADLCMTRLECAIALRQVEDTLALLAAINGRYRAGLAASSGSKKSSFLRLRAVDNCGPKQKMLRNALTADAEFTRLFIRPRRSFEQAVLACIREGSENSHLLSIFPIPSTSAREHDAEYQELNVSLMEAALVTSSMLITTGTFLGGISASAAFSLMTATGVATSTVIYLLSASAAFIWGLILATAASALTVKIKTTQAKTVSHRAHFRAALEIDLERAEGRRSELTQRLLHRFDVEEKYFQPITRCTQVGSSSCELYLLLLLNLVPVVAFIVGLAYLFPMAACEQFDRLEGSWNGSCRPVMWCTAIMAPGLAIIITLLEKVLNDSNREKQ